MPKKNPNAVALGKKGGAKTKKRGSDYFREIGAKGKMSRWYPKKSGQKAKKI